MTATEQQRPAAGEYVGEEMTLWEHLEELRSRLFKSALALAVSFSIGFVFRQQVFDLLIRPYCDLPARLRAASSVFSEERCSLVFTDVLGAFFLTLKAAAVVAIVLGGPIVCYQIWRFVTPGLRPVERRYAVPFLVLSQVLFGGGAVFSYFVIPRALEFLLGFAGDNVVSLMDANRYLSFLLQTMIAFGASFEVPLILAMLVLMGTLQRATLIRFRRHAIFSAFVMAAVITPTQDPITMLVMAGPLILFYEITVVFAFFLERGRARRAAASADRTAADAV